jgi:hypothetical protein
MYKSIISKLNNEQREILVHTLTRAANNQYCEDSPDMQGLVSKGLMREAGKKAFCPDKYFHLTGAGLRVANRLRSEQEKAHKLKIEQEEDKASETKLMERFHSLWGQARSGSYNKAEWIAMQDTLEAALKGCTQLADPVDPNKPATSWDEVPGCIDSRPAVTRRTCYGISRAVSGKELHVDFGDNQELTTAVLYYRGDDRTNWKDYCKGIRLDIKVTEHPALELKETR